MASKPKTKGEHHEGVALFVIVTLAGIVGDWTGRAVFSDVFKREIEIGNAYESCDFAMTGKVECA